MKFCTNREARKPSSLFLALLLAFTIAANANRIYAQDPITPSSLLVKISPRLKPGGNGRANITLHDETGAVVTTFNVPVGYATGLAEGVKGPKRNITNGDTPFGVYKFVTTAGGKGYELGTGYGTGKIYLDDNDMFGEVVEAHRKLIRLHGGGTGLADPFADNQPLLKTLGCIRMKNKDVNALIDLIKTLAEEKRPKFVFMGDTAYLNSLAKNTSLSMVPWWQVLRNDLHLNTNARLAAGQERGSRGIFRRVNWLYGERRQNTETLRDLIVLFSTDVGQKGAAALLKLRLRQDELPQFRDSLELNDSLRPKIAFVLCYLGRDCDNGINVLNATISTPSDYKGFFQDEAQDLISRLIDKKMDEGNLEPASILLRALFVAANESDGALSEGLAITFTKIIRDRTILFFNTFKQFSVSVLKAAWLRVYTLISSLRLLSVSDVLRIRSRFKSIPAEPNFRKAFITFSGSYLQLLKKGHP